MVCFIALKAEEKKRKENERRRRKLEQMRQRASDGNDHIPVESDEEGDNMSTHEDCRVAAKDPVSIKLTVYTENLNVSLPDSTSANLVSTLCEAGRPSSFQASFTIPESRSSRSNSLANSPVSDIGGTSKMDISVKQANLLVQGPRNSRSNSSVNSSTSDVTGLSNGIPESDAIVNEVLVASNEPDIIRITKTRTPPSTLPYPPSAPHNTLTFPVAPPRKKKRSGSEVR